MYTHFCKAYKHLCCCCNITFLRWPFYRHLICNVYLCRIECLTRAMMPFNSPALKFTYFIYLREYNENRNAHVQHLSWCKALHFVCVVCSGSFSRVIVNLKLTLRCLLIPLLLYLYYIYFTLGFSEIWWSAERLKIHSKAEYLLLEFCTYKYVRIKVSYIIMSSMSNK